MDMIPGYGTRLCLVSASLWTGCAGVHLVGQPASQEELRAIESEANGRTIALKLAPDRTLEVKGLHAGGEALSWTGPPAGAAPVTDLREATVVRRGTGFLQGAGIGALAGFATGTVLGIISNTFCSTGKQDGTVGVGQPYYPNNSCSYTTGPSFSGGVVIGAIFGGVMVLPSALIGGGVGAMIGSPLTFTSAPRPALSSPPKAAPSGPRSCNLDSDCDLGPCIESLCRGDYH